jgi:hypothetical protein
VGSTVETANRIAAVKIVGAKSMACKQNLRPGFLSEAPKPTTNVPENAAFMLNLEIFPLKSGEKVADFVLSDEFCTKCFAFSSPI